MLDTSYPPVLDTTIHPAHPPTPFTLAPRQQQQLDNERPYDLVKWICPWHHCDECGRAASHRCVKCPNSFCVDHATTSIFNSEYGLVCMEHDLTGIDTNSTAPPPPSLVSHTPPPLITTFSN